MLSRTKSVLYDQTQEHDTHAAIDAVGQFANGATFFAFFDLIQGNRIDSQIVPNSQLLHQRQSCRFRDVA